MAEIQPEALDALADRVAERLAARAPAMQPAPRVVPVAAPRPAAASRSSAPEPDVRPPEAPIDPGRVSSDSLRAAERAVQTATRWLAARQADDGSFSADHGGRHSVGLSALSMLALLADERLHGDRRHEEEVRAAARWLTARVQPDGRLVALSSHHQMYDQAYGSLALVRWAARTGTETDRAYAQRAVDFALTARNPYLGWRYGIRDGDNDTSVTSLMVRVLDVAEEAGLEVHSGAFQGARAWVEKMRDPDVGRVGYLQRGGLPARTQESFARFPAKFSEAPTAMGVLTTRTCERRLGDDPSDLSASLDLIASKPPHWDAEAGSIDLYYWYWGTLASAEQGGAHWNTWARALLPALTEHQRDDAEADGSWDPVGAWGAEGGRLYSTAIATLTLAEALRAERRTD